MKKKLVSVLVCVGMLAGLAVQPVSAAEEEGLSGEIHVAAWNAAADGLIEIADKFMEANPNATVVVDKVDAEYTKLYPALASGIDVPDVVQIQQTDIQAFLNNYPDSFADLTDILEPEKDNFVASALDVTMVDGKYYAIPWDIGPCAMMYRKDIFEEAGVDAASITTWEEFLEAGKIVLEKTGAKMFGFCYNGSSSSDGVKLFLHQQGGVYYDEDGNVDLTTDKMYKTISFLQEMVDAGITMDLPSEWDDRITALNANQIACLPYPVWYTGTLMSSVADQSGLWGIVPMPCFEGEESGEVSMGGCVLAISASSEAPELAKAFAAYAMMDDEANEINFKWGQFTSYKPSYEAEAFKTVDEYFGVSRGEIFTQLVNSPVINFGSYFTDVDSALKTAIGEIFINGTDPETALTEAEEAAQRAIDAK